MSECNNDPKTIKRMIENIKSKKISRTVLGKSNYRNLFYCDDENKICFAFTPRSGCSVCFQQFLHLVGLLEDANNFSSFVHNYRMFLNSHLKVVPIKKLVEQKYLFIKFIINPYRRIVSCFNYRANEYKKEMSFREYLKNLLRDKNDDKIFSNDEIWHHQNQYINGEKDIINFYYVVNENPIYIIRLFDGRNYAIDLSKFQSVHHTKKTNIQNFCGDIKYKDLINKFPQDYKCMYDHEIKSLVDEIFKIDIKQYNFKFIYD
jgi:hypothetical protein